MKKRKPVARVGRVRRVLAIALFGLLVWSIGSVVLLRWMDPPTTAFIVADRVHAWLNAEPGYRFQQHWVGGRRSHRYEARGGRFGRPALADHFGFDFVGSNTRSNNAMRQIAAGASTITQQTAKNLFLWSGQSWIRKGFEAYFTLLIETFWPKTRILEVYLNVAEFGQGVFGVGAASERFFREPAARLNRSQSALLAAVLPNPATFRVNSPSRYVRMRQAWILQQMNSLGGEHHINALDD
jgi:monofunctional biosynthetic peptidoglycan transglycosylase